MLLQLSNHYLTRSHHCRCQTPYHCRILNWQYHIDNRCGNNIAVGGSVLSLTLSTHKPSRHNSPTTTLSACGADRQSWLNLHCRLMDRADSVAFQVIHKTRSTRELKDYQRESGTAALACCHRPAKENSPPRNAP